MEERIVTVTNRNNGFTGYKIPDTGMHRLFTLNETKRLPLEELRQLQFVPGGDYILKNCLLINDRDALSALDMDDVEPEYFYTDKEVKELLESGTLDQLEDALNFAPAGVIEIIKKMAVDMELPDTRKRKLITEKTGLNIDNAITVNMVMNSDSDTEVKAEASSVTRKASPITTEKKPAERKYKIVK